MCCVYLLFIHFKFNKNFIGTFFLTVNRSNPILNVGKKSTNGKLTPLLFNEYHIVLWSLQNYLK